jgi:hypothetical protein
MSDVYKFRLKKLYREGERTEEGDKGMGQRKTVKKK